MVLCKEINDSKNGISLINIFDEISTDEEQNLEFQVAIFTNTYGYIEKDLHLIFINNKDKRVRCIKTIELKSQKNEIKNAIHFMGLTSTKKPNYKRYILEVVSSKKGYNFPEISIKDELDKLYEDQIIEFETATELIFN